MWGSLPILETGNKAFLVKLMRGTWTATMAHAKTRRPKEREIMALALRVGRPPAVGAFWGNAPFFKMPLGLRVLSEAGVRFWSPPYQ